MGTDTFVHFPHQIEPRDLPGVPELLNARCGGLEGLASGWARHETLEDDPSLWSWAEVFGPEYRAKDLANAMASEGDFSNPPCVRGPCGLFISIGRRSGFVSLSRWEVFLNNESYQTDAREACRTVARALGGEELLYLPDQIFKESRWGTAQDYHAMREEMRSELGPPAPTLEHVRLLIDTIRKAWKTDTALNVLHYSDSAWPTRCNEVEREVRTQFPHAAYFVEPVD